MHTLAAFAYLRIIKLKFEKIPLSISEHISLLKGRDLTISDEGRCAKYLKHIGYYRLSAYFLPYQTNDEHLFKPGTSFDDVLNLYIFDRKLRILFLDIIERIEISLRAQLIDSFCHAYGTHGYTDEELFKPRYDHKWLINKISKDITRSHESFIQHYLNTYTSPQLPPFWMVAQILSFSELSILIENIKDDSILNDMALSLNIHKPVFLSWLKSLSQLRNICAHHGRLWNRVFGIKPKTVKKPINLWKGLSFSSKSLRNAKNL